MVTIGVGVLAMLSLALLAFFDTLVYRQSFFHVIGQLYGQVPHFAASGWMLALAFLLAAWNDLNRRPFIKRILAKASGERRKEQDWKRN